MSSPSVFLTAPVAGRVFPISKSSDETFSQEILGGGFLIYPEVAHVPDVAQELNTEQSLDAGAAGSQVALAPITGQVVSLFPHAVAISGTGVFAGIDLLVHLGVETVKLKGQGFELLTEKGAQLKQNQPWCRWEPSMIATAGYSTEVLVVLLAGSFKINSLGQSVRSGQQLFFSC